MSTGLFDPETGEVHEPDDGCPKCALAQRGQIDAELALRDAEKELRRLRREVTLVRNELTRQRNQSPEGVKAKALFRYWLARCKKSEARTVFGEKRQKAVIARLREHEATYIARAIDGLAEGCYVHPDNGIRYDDLELVCRDEVHLERFYNLAEAVSAPTLVGPAWLQEFEGKLGPAEDQNAGF